MIRPSFDGEDAEHGSRLHAADLECDHATDAVTTDEERSEFLGGSDSQYVLRKQLDRSIRRGRPALTVTAELNQDECQCGIQPGNHFVPLVVIVKAARDQD
jgi:hypothetical protein